MDQTHGPEIIFVDDRLENGRIEKALTYVMQTLADVFHLNTTGVRHLVVAPSIDRAASVAGTRDWNALNVMANASAAAFTEIREGRVETTVAIARERAAMLLDPVWAPEMVHTLHHELAHAHDHNANQRAVQAYTGLGAPTNARSLAVMIWAEYFAARRSGPTGTWEHVHLRSRGLAHQIREHGLAMHEIGEMARTAPNPTRLLDAALRIGREWLYTAALTRGYLDAFEIEAIAHEELGVWLHDSDFEPLWDEMTAILRSLYARFGDWGTPDVFEPLTVVVTDFFETFDFVFDEERSRLSPRSHWLV